AAVRLDAEMQLKHLGLSNGPVAVTRRKRRSAMSPSANSPTTDVAAASSEPSQKNALNTIFDKLAAKDTPPPAQPPQSTPQQPNLPQSTPSQTTSQPPAAAPNP